MQLVTVPCVVYKTSLVIMCRDRVPDYTRLAEFFFHVYQLLVVTDVRVFDGNVLVIGKSCDFVHGTICLCLSSVQGDSSWRIRSTNVRVSTLSGSSSNTILPIPKVRD